MTRIGLVSSRHPCADAVTMDVREYAELPMIHNPELPRNWMAPWILGDVRSDRDAALIPVAADDFAAVRTSLASGRFATVGYAGFASSLPQSMRAIELRDAPSAHWHAAFREDDAGAEPTQAVVAALGRQLARVH